MCIIVYNVGGFHLVINNKLIKHYLKNVLFINGTAYAGKSTMVKMLAEKYDLLHCGENYNCVPEGIFSPEEYPNIFYTKLMKNWQEFVNRTPDDYNRWVVECSKEYEEFEITYLIHMSQYKKTIVDTNISLETLKEIADYNQVVIMLSPQSMSVDNFFARDDSEKKFLKEQIMKTNDPEKTMNNFLECMAKINSQENYEKWANSGFLTIVRNDTIKDTKFETLEIIEKHFGLKKGI